MEDLSSIPGSERSLGEENGNPLQYSSLENPMDGGRSLVGCKLRTRDTFPMFYRYSLFPSLFTLSGLPGVLVVKNSSANAGDIASVPGLEISHIHGAIKAVSHNY